MNRESRVKFGWKAFPLVACVGLVAGSLVGSGERVIATTLSGCGGYVDCHSYANKQCNACGTGFITCGYRVLATGLAHEIDYSVLKQFSGVDSEDLTLCTTRDGCSPNTTECPTNATKKVCVPNNEPFDLPAYTTGVFSQNDCED